MRSALINTGRRKLKLFVGTIAWGLASIFLSALAPVFAEDVFNTHKVILDSQNKIIPWFGPAEKAYDHFLRLRWDFIKTKAPNSPGPPPRILLSAIFLLLRLSGSERDTGAGHLDE